MKSTNRGEIPFALAQLFNIKGRTGMELDETAVAVAVVAQMTDSPYLRYAVPCIRHMGLAALAANFGYILCSPGPTKILQIRQLLIKNNDAAAIADFGLRIGSAAFVAQLDTAVSTAQFVDIGAGPAPKSLSSVVRSFHDVAGTDTGSLSIGSYFVPISASLIVTFPEPGIFLYGNDEGGIPALAVRHATLAVSFAVTFMGREWPLPGQ